MKRTKRYNCPTSSADTTTVDTETTRTAREFINASTLYTREVEAELDRLIGIGSPTSEVEPDEEYLNPQEENWDDETPDKSAFEFDETA